MRTAFFALSGPSGVGKTTALRLLLKSDFAGRDLRVLRKITTRALKPSDNPAELSHQPPDLFDAFIAEAKLMLSFTRHGHRFGLVKPVFDERDARGNSFYIQAIPVRVAQQMQAEQGAYFDVKIIRLAASEQTICKRLRERGDQISDAEIQSRLKTAQVAVEAGIDYCVDAERPKEVVANAIAAYIRSHLPT